VRKTSLNYMELPLISVDIMVFVGGIKPPCVTLTIIEYFGKQEETLKHWT
jgi:hypothetical protein